MPKRIVLATIGSLGDLHPLLALAIQLRSRGHDVLLASASSYRVKVQAAGIAFATLSPESIDDPANDPELMGRVMDLHRGPRFLIRELIMPKVTELYQQLLPLCEGADLLITGEIVFAAPLVSERLGLPWVSAILSPASFFSAHDLPVMTPWSGWTRHAGLPLNRLLVGLGRRATRSWARPIDRLRAELGLYPARHPLFDDKFSPWLTLAMFSPHFAHPQPDWPANTEVTGFIFYDRDDRPADPDLHRFLEQGEPPIVFTLGSAAVVNPGDFYQQSLEIARDLGRRALLLTGRNAIASTPDALAIPYAPYSEVFPRAAAIVHQGGIGTTAQGLRAGVPQLILPHAYDQPDNAARVQRLGLGRMLTRSHYKPRTAVPVLRELLEGRSVRTQTQAFAANLSPELGLTDAVEAIERLLNSPEESQLQ